MRLNKLKNIFRKKRYYLVSYQFTIPDDNIQGFGNMTFWTYKKLLTIRDCNYEDIKRDVWARAGRRSEVEIVILSVSRIGGYNVK